MKYSFKFKLWAVILTLAMLLPMIPVVSLPVSAAGILSVSDANIGLSWTDASNSKGKANWTASGTTVTGTAEGYKGGFMNLGKYIVTTTLTITNNHSDDRTLSFDYTLIKGGSVSGIISDTSGSYSDTLAAGASTTITLTSPKGTSMNTLTISGLALLSASNVTSTFLAPENGSYTVDGVAVTAQKQLTKPSTESYALSATPATDYMFFGWWSEASQSYVSYDATASLKFSADPQLKPVFLHNTTALFGVGTKTFADLTEAATFAASSAATTKTVLLLNNGTVSGSHTIPAGVTLLVPHNSSNTKYGASPKCTTETFLGVANNATAWVQPTAYRTLTLAEGAQITVSGSIELAGQHAASNGAKTYCGAPSGPLGWMQMASGSHITLNSGANLYCWGYIQGGGTITAKSGAKVYENFQFTDFRGGSNLTAMMGEAGMGLVFPINQYYVQNIQNPITYEAGAEEYVATSAFASKQVLGGTVKFLGNGGMFTPAAGATITKDYIESSDRLQIEVAGDASLNSLRININVDIDSSKFVLPITNNISIILKSGTTEITQSVSLLPGAEITIDQGATLVIAKGDGGINDFTTESYGLIVYDYDEWTYGISMTDGSMVTGKYAFGDGSKNYSGQMAPLNYVPGRTYNRTLADLKDAKLDVNGTIICNGYLYTTLGGANIMSSKETGIIQLVSGAGNDMMDFQSNDAASLAIPMQAAQLKNGDGSYTSTYIYHYDEEGMLVVDYQAPANTTYAYCATHDCWYTGECEECNAKYTITWNTGAQDVTEDYDANAVPTYKGTPPTKAQDAQYTYTFAGWKDANGTQYPVGTDLPAVTGSATYTAYFTATTRKYEIKWVVNGITTTKEVAYGTTPSYGVTDPTKDSDVTNHYTFTGWDVTPVAVTGPANYTAEFNGEAHDKDKIEGGRHYCSVCDYNMGNCSDTDSTDHVCDNGGEQMVCCADYLTPTDGKDPTCTEAGWKDYYICSCGKLYADAEAKTEITLESWKTGDGKLDMSSHKGTIVYTNNGETHSAVYSECGCVVVTGEAHGYTNGVCVCQKVQTFTVTWIADGKTVDTETVEYGKNTTKNPTIPAKTGYSAAWDKTATNVTSNVTITAVYTVNKYTITWNVNGVTTTETYAYGAMPSFKGSTVKAADEQYTYKFAGWDKEIATVSGNATYTAQYDKTVNEYTITWVVDGKSTTETYAYGAMPSFKGSTDKAADAQYTYTFTGWDPAVGTVTGNATYTAQYDKTVNEYTITWIVDGKSTTETYAYGATPSFKGSTDKAADEQYTYTFAGWSPAIAEVTGDATYTAQYSSTVIAAIVIGEGKQTEYYASLTDANNGAEAGDTIIMLKDATLTGKLTVDKNVTIDGNGHKIVANHTYYILEAGSDCTIKNIILDTNNKAKGVKIASGNVVLDNVTIANHSKGWNAIKMTGGNLTFKTYLKVNTTVGILDANNAVSVTVAEGTVFDFNKWSGHASPTKCDLEGAVDVYGNPYFCAYNSTGYLVSLASATSFKDLVLLKDATLALTRDKTLNNETIDLNGHTLTVAGAKLVVNGAATVKGEGTIAGEIVLGKTEATIEGTAAMNVTTTGEGHHVVYKNGVYSVAYTGWKNDGTGTYYVIDNEILRTGWTEIENTWYYLNPETGYRAEGITRVPYPTVEINSITYVCPETDASDKFIDYSSALFVFDADGRLQQTTGIIYDKEGMPQHYAVNGMIPWHYGLATNGTDYYYFIGDTENGGNKLDSGDVYLTKSNNLTINGKTVIFKGVYTFGADGKLCFYDGVTKVGEDLRYYYDYCYTAKSGLIAVEDQGETKYIYVRSSTAKLVANAEYWVPANVYNIVPGYYVFSADGYLTGIEYTTKNGIFYENGGYYYYVDGAKCYAGLIQYKGTASDGTEYNDAYIYVRSNGQLATGQYWITRSNGLMETKTYLFNECGIMDIRDGIVEENGSLYFYVDGVLAKGKGLVKIDENYYYVRSSGEVVNNCDYWITNTNEYDIVAKIYTFDENGVMIEPESKEADLTGVVDGYYFLNGEIQYGAGPIIWEGNIYYVRSNGMVATGKYWTTAENEILPSGRYTFDETGKLITG